MFDFWVRLNQDLCIQVVKLPVVIQKLLPPIKAYETQQTTEGYLLKEKEMVKLPRDELDFLKKNDDVNESKRDGKSLFLRFKPPY